MAERWERRLQSEPAAHVPFQLESLASYEYRPALLSWLRAGYLVGFAAFGYRYIRLPGLQVVRDQIANPDADLLQVFSLTDVSVPPTEYKLLVLEHPVSCLAVQLGRHTVLLPWVGTEGALYDRLAHAKAQHDAGGGGRTGMSGRVFPWWPRGPEHRMDFMDPSG